MKIIPPFRLKPEPLTEEARNLPKFKWATEEMGTRHQLGGSPQHIQSEFRPVCPDCKEKMTFYAQLDSINDEFCLADCGMIYVFVCFDCFTVEAFIESY
ncbi:MAG: hypothetical protein BWY31_03435 [Lentisphaerae bacterium ADurb.Bin242]|nr:MAG: hypothetical protein BWY31_03435 [Lentisphaerae bacterium ADurb.Bin242]